MSGCSSSDEGQTVSGTTGGTTAGGAAGRSSGSTPAANSGSAGSGTATGTAAGRGGQAAAGAAAGRGGSTTTPKPAGASGGAGAGAAGETGAEAGEAGSDEAPAGGTGGTGGSSEAGSGATVSAAEISEIASQLAKSVCGALLECLGQQKRDAIVGREDCETRFAGSLAQDELGSLAESAARGRVKLQSDQLAQCYADTRALACEVQSQRLPASCQSAIQGQVAPGATCSIGSDCSGDSYCSTGECPRTCSARGTAAAACARNEECQSGLVCVAQRCAAPVTAGEACAGASGAVCALGTSCFGSTTTTSGVCRANSEIQIGVEGAVCSPAGELCQEGLSCAYDGGAGFSCQQIATAGGVCRKGAPSQCPNDQYCTAPDVMTDGTCAALPVDGQPCVLANACAAGHVCLPDAAGTPVCATFHDLGDACTQDAVCRSGVCTDGACAVRAVCD